MLKVTKHLLTVGDYLGCSLNKCCCLYEGIQVLRGKFRFVRVFKIAAWISSELDEVYAPDIFFSFFLFFFFFFAS